MSRKIPNKKECGAQRRYVRAYPWTSEEKAVAEGMRSAGIPTKDIANHFKVSPQSVQRVVQEIRMRRRLGW